PQHSRGLPGRLGVDPGDPGVRDGAAGHRQVEHAGELDVVGPPRPAGDQPGVLLAPAGPAHLAGAGRGVDLARLGGLAGDLLGRHVAHDGTSAVAGWLPAPFPDAGPAAARTARTMFW